MSELILGFAILALFIFARRLNRDEDFIVDLRNRVKELEDKVNGKNTQNQSEPR